MRMFYAGTALLCFVSAAEAQVVTYNWSGLYVGAHLGYGDGGDALRFYDPKGRGRRLRYTIDGFSGVFGGAQAGYNWQLPSGWVVGVEADISGAGISGFRQDPPRTFREYWGTEIGVMGTVRARLGYAFDSVLLYGTGGFVGAESRVYEKLVGPGDLKLPGEWNSEFRPGWTVGGGVEWALAGNWSVKGEYLFVRLESGGDYTPGHSDLHTVRFGVNYRFGDAAGGRARQP